MVHAASSRRSRRLEADEAGLTMEARLVRGAGRIARDAASVDGPPALREEQVRVFAGFATYLTDVATRPPTERRPPFCRIILPPRTGKTAIAGHIIDRSSLTAAFIVPTRALLDQTVRELALWAPGVAVGSYSGERQSVVEHGVNVVTYAMLQTHAAALPPELRRSALVFVDEAHHAMTASRRAILAGAFDPQALRVALTATPDYDRERRLAHDFPDLVHEITLEEALALDLLAPLRVWVAEVDADGSRVRFVAGDFQADDLGRLMSSAPFFRAIEVFRYDPENAHRPCLVACASRQQAHDLFQYLRRHRPASSPPPVLVLGDTPRERRERALAAFERGRVDTIIQVGVLLEGWSSPRCKLLLDLAPSVSRVRATQKYFRVMTRHGDEEARIVVLLPARLPTTPVLPMDLFGALGEYVCGDLVGRPGGGSLAALMRTRGTPVAGVDLRSRILVDGAVHKPALDPASLDQIREVLDATPGFSPETCGVYRFAGLWFRHRLFTGRGDFLLRWLQVPMTRDAYDRWLARVYPEAAANRILAEHGECVPDRGCADEVGRLLRKLRTRSSDGRPQEPFVSAWYALTGTASRPPGDPAASCAARQDWSLAFRLLCRLPRRKRRMMIHYFGLFGAPETSVPALAEMMALSRTRVDQLVRRSIDKLRQWRALAAASEATLAGPEASVTADAVQRRAKATARAATERARYLDDLLSQQDAIWERVEARLLRPIASGHDWALTVLQDLGEAADQLGARSAFEARIAELRTRTPRATRFWRRWSARRPRAS